MVRRRGSGSVFGGGSERVPVPKLSRSNSNLGRSRSRSRKPPGKVAIAVGLVSMFLCFGGAVAGFVGLTVELSYRAGWAGTPGTASLITCESYGSGRDRHTDCDGQFRDDAGVPSLVSVEGDDTYTILRVYPARLHADGQTVSIVGAKPVVYQLGGLSAVLGIAVFLGWAFAISLVGVVLRRRRGGLWRPARWVNLVPPMVGVALIGLGIVGGIVGAVLSF